jgi:iron complex outermembrane receptor protein
VSGQDLPYTPDTNINASVKWDMLSFDAGDLTLWLDSSYRSDANTLVGGEAVTIDGYTLFNGRLSFNAENWSVSVWGRNLTEEKYYTAFFDLDYFGVAYGNPGAPLTFGAEFSYYW